MAVEEGLYECNFKYNRVEYTLGDNLNSDQSNSHHSVNETSSSPIPFSIDKTFSTTAYSAHKQSSLDDDEDFINIEPYKEDEKLDILVQTSNDTSSLETPSIVTDSENALPSWIQANGKDYPRSPFMRLHQEIVNFCDFISPTIEENNVRLEAIDNVKKVAKSIWPSCKVEVFGSFASGLYLPSSDCDMVILDVTYESEAQALRALARGLSRFKVGKDIKPILRAKVPIVKFIEVKSNIAFDICLNRPGGIDAANFIKNSIQLIPPLRPLCLILKIFIQQRELNEVYSGGLGSFALIIMIIAHLQLHTSWKYSKRLETNLGILLLDFFELYGRLLNIKDVGVSCNDGGRFFSKKEKKFYDLHKPNLLSVQDPLESGNDIAKNSYNILSIRWAFQHAHKNLFSLSPQSFSSPAGLLSRIIRCDPYLTHRSKPASNLVWRPFTYQIDPNFSLETQTLGMGKHVRDFDLTEFVDLDSSGDVYVEKEVRDSVQTEAVDSDGLENNTKRKLDDDMEGGYERWNPSDHDDVNKSTHGVRKKRKRKNRSLSGMENGHDDDGMYALGFGGKGKEKVKGEARGERMSLEDFIHSKQEERRVKVTEKGEGSLQKNDHSYVYDFFMGRSEPTLGQDDAFDPGSESIPSKKSKKKKKKKQKEGNEGNGEKKDDAIITPNPVAAILSSSEKKKKQKKKKQKKRNENGNEYGNENGNEFGNQNGNENRNENRNKNGNENGNDKKNWYRNRYFREKDDVNGNFYFNSDMI